MTSHTDLLARLDSIYNSDAHRELDGLAAAAIRELQAQLEATQKADSAVAKSHK